MHPNAGEAAESYFQAARPINADSIRILCMPAAPLREYFSCEAIFSGKAVRLDQRNQMLVAVQFPSDFAVADLSKIQITNAVKWLFGRSFLMDGVKMPVDFLSGFKIGVAQKIEAVRTNLVRTFNNFAGLFGQALANQTE